MYDPLLVVELFVHATGEQEGQEDAVVVVATAPSTEGTLQMKGFAMLHAREYQRPLLASKAVQ